MGKNGEKGSRYALCAFTRVVATSLARFVHLACRLSTLPQPRTIEDWSRYERVFFSDTRKSCLPRGFSLGEGAYHLRWLLRAWQLVEMRAKGSRRLRIDAEVTAIQLADVTADQHSWIRRVARPREKAVALIKRLQYTDAPEHLSMWWCVFCSVLPFVDPTWLESHVQRLVQLATAYEGKYGLPPHPLTLISLATGKSDMA